MYNKIGRGYLYFIRGADKIKIGISIGKPEKRPTSATSQFYINLKDNSANLDSNYSVFGVVVDGMSVVDAIGQVQTDTNDKPLQDVTLIKAEFVEP